MCRGVRRHVLLLAAMVAGAGARGHVRVKTRGNFDEWLSINRQENQNQHNFLTVPSSLGEDLLPQPDECGLRARKSPRVTFGDDAPFYAFPWMTILGYKDEDDPKWMCGGALINERYVLTAAHCVLPAFTSDEPQVGRLVKVRLGEHNLDTDIDCPDNLPHDCAPPPQDFYPEEIIPHKNFTLWNKHNDISLIRLARPAIYSQSVQPVCLPPLGLSIKLFLGTRHAVVTGWGTTEHGTAAKVLQRGPVPLEDNEECEKDLMQPMNEGQLCFGGRDKVDSCRGDSGGPLVQAREGSKRYTLLGLVSFGSVDCGVPGISAIYTNVIHYRNWIVSNLRP